MRLRTGLGVVLVVLALTACSSDDPATGPDQGADASTWELTPEELAARETCLSHVPDGQQMTGFGPSRLDSTRLIARENDQRLDPVWDGLPDDHVVAYCTFAVEPGVDDHDMIVDTDGRTSAQPDGPFPPDAG